MKIIFQLIYQNKDNENNISTNLEQINTNKLNISD